MIMFENGKIDAATKTYKLTIMTCPYRYLLITSDKIVRIHAPTTRDKYLRTLSPLPGGGRDTFKIADIFYGVDGTLLNELAYMSKKSDKIHFKILKRNLGMARRP